MPPERRSRRSSTLLQPYNKGFLSRCRRNARRRPVAGGAQHDENGTAAILDDDAIGRVFAGFLDGASVVRCAVTCRHWARVVASDAAVISRALKPPGRRLPDLALGFFYQENDGPRSRTRIRSRTAATTVLEPSFVPTASCRRRFFGVVAPCALGSLMNRLPCAGILDHARPVASRNGRLVLELRRDSHADGVRLCVCNPMAGDMEAALPELSGDDMPGYYACALLTGDDDLTQHRPTFFRLLLVYNRRGFTAHRCYSSDDGRWGPEVRKAGDKIPGEKLRRLGPAVVVRGVAYWALSNAVFGVRLTTRELDSSAVRFLGCPRDPYTDTRLLTVSPEEGRLSFISTRPCGGVFCMQAYVFRGGDDDDGDTAGEWEHCGPPKVCFPQLHVTDPLDIKMRFFCEKSGVVFFALGRCSRTPGTYVLSLETNEVEKLVDGEGFSWKGLCGYEIDHAAYLTLLVR